MANLKRAGPVDGMKALRLRTRWDYRVRGTTLGGVSRERRRSRWNISRSTHTSTTRWLQWSGPTAIWCERNGLSMTAARCANSWNVASVDRPSRSRRSATGTGLSTRSRPRAAFPSFVHARKAKLMMGEINKTDKLDARGLNRLQRNATLPTVWIPPGELRDQRDLPRTRTVFVRQRTQLKNRIHATLAKYALHDLELSDLFGVQGRALLRERFDLLPPHTAYASQQLLEQVEELDRRVRE